MCRSRRPYSADGARVILADSERVLTTSPLNLVILAGGLGTRLRLSLPNTQKVMAPVGGIPMLRHLLRQCAHAGFSAVTLAVGYREEDVRSTLGEETDGVTVRYSREDVPLGTGGALANALAGMAVARTMVLNGDSLIDVDLASVVAWHRARHARASIVVTSVEDVSRFGSIETTSHGEVTLFREKADAPSGAGMINAGVYVFEPDALPSKEHRVRFSLEREILPGLVGNGLYAWAVPKQFFDIGIPESLENASRLMERPLARYSQHGLVVLDRDGTLIAERNYLADPSGVELLPGAAEGVSGLKELGHRVVVATNQSGIARGMFTMATLDAIHARMVELLSEQGAVLDGLFVCPHGPEDGCTCRKPQAGLVQQARRVFGDLPVVAVVGDKACDIDLGVAVGATTILVTSGYGSRAFLLEGVKPDFVVDDLVGAVHVVREVQSWSTPEEHRRVQC